MKKQTLFIMVGLWLTVLAGCGQDEVIYGEDAGSREQEEVQGEVQENKPSGTLRDLLEMGDEKEWEETIEGIGGTINVKAEIRVPDATNLYTMTATKYYLTGEDKKRIAEYFMDADTIKVNKEMVSTKESIQKSIDEQESLIQELYASDPVDEAAVNYYKQYVEELKTQLVSASYYDDVEEEPGTYNENYYIGNKGRGKYFLMFYTAPYTDDPASICSWDVYREELLNSDTGVEDLAADKMSEEKAGERAKKMCEDLGISGMEVVSVESAESLDDSGNETGHMEYYVDLVRHINGVPVDSNTYDVPQSYVDSEVSVIPYPQEWVSMTFDDYGLVGMGYGGCVKAGEIGDTVRLLSYNQVLEVFRRELGEREPEETAKKNTWTLLELSYLRVAYENEPDAFAYIPVWRLGRKYDEMMYSTEKNIWINAIDGSRVYPEKMGAAANFLAW